MDAIPQFTQDERDDEPIALSALQHAIYCLRQAALIHLERLWAENRFTAEGQILHNVADKPSSRKIKNVRRVTNLAIGSRKYGIAGKADLVEFIKEGDTEIIYPVEYKRGKSKLHRADEVQLCAQALCLEEMSGMSIPEGALFYAETKRRLIVPFDIELRELTIKTINELREVFKTQITPPPTQTKSRCRACSLFDLCDPKSVTKGAAAWLKKQISQSIIDEDSVE